MPATSETRSRRRKRAEARESGSANPKAAGTKLVSAAGAVERATADLAAARQLYVDAADAFREHVAASRPDGAELTDADAGGVLSLWLADAIRDGHCAEVIRPGAPPRLVELWRAAGPDLTSLTRAVVEGAS